MCTCTSVFGRCVGRGPDHPRLRKPSEGGRKGVCFPRSPSAARLVRRMVLSSRSATSTADAGWAAKKTLWRWFCSPSSSYISRRRGLGSTQDLWRGFCSSSRPGGACRGKCVLGAGSTSSRVHGDLEIFTLGRGRVWCERPGRGRGATSAELRDEKTGLSGLWLSLLTPHLL